METKNASKVSPTGWKLTNTGPDLSLKVWVQQMELKTDISIALTFGTVLEARPWVSSSSIRRVGTLFLRGTSMSNRKLSVEP